MAEWRQPVEVEQCSVLFIKSGSRDDRQIKALRSLGFRVVEAEDLPAPDVLHTCHALVVRVKRDCPLAMLGTRLRAKPRFGRRALIALAPDGTSEREKRDAMSCGVDLVLDANCSARDIAAHILRLLRPYPEYRCLLRAPNGRRKAA
jgi:hypothetical protein